MRTLPFLFARVAASAALFPVLALAGEALPPAGSSATYAELSLEQLMEIRIERVFSASKYEQKVTRAPAAVTIVSSDEIAKYGHRTLADVLRSVRGLYVSNDRNYSYLGVRGFLRPGDYNSRVLVLVDGHRMNDNIYDAAYFGRENMVDVGAVERVEVIRGPSSSIYGSSAFFGVINVVTKPGAKAEGLEVSSEAASYHTGSVRATYGHLFRNDLELFLSASTYRSVGPHSLYYPEFDPRVSTNPLAANNGLARNADGEWAQNLSGSLRYHGFTLSAMYAAREKHVPTASFWTVFNDGREKTTDYRAYVDLQFQHAVHDDLQVSGRTYFDWAWYSADYPYEPASPTAPRDESLYKDYFDGQWVGTEWQLTRRLGDRHTIVAGVEWRENLRQKQFAYYNTQPREYSLDDDRATRNAGAYVQGEFGLRSNLLLNAGLRYDYYFDGFGGTLNPRLGLIYNPAKHTTVKVLYGQAFRAPNVYERFYYASRMPQELTPERVRTGELVLEQYFARDYRLSISGYRYDVRDLISQVESADRFAFANADRTHAKGVEVELAARYASGLQVSGSVALQRATDGATGAELSASPRRMAKFNALVPLVYDWLTAGLELQYYGTMGTIAGARANDFVLANLTLTTRRLPGRLELSAGVYNFLNANYGYPGAEDHAQDLIQQDGRTWRVKLSRRF